MTSSVQDVVNLPPIFDNCLEDDCEIRSSKQIEQFGVDEFCGVENVRQEKSFRLVILLTSDTHILP